MEKTSTPSREGTPDRSEGIRRYAFILKLRPGMAGAYDEAHRSVPSDLIALLRRAGLSEYSIFRRDQLLFLTLRARDFEEAWRKVETDPAYARWQKRMEGFFEPADDLQKDEGFAMMQEVFYMQ